MQYAPNWDLMLPPIKSDCVWERPPPGEVVARWLFILHTRHTYLVVRYTKPQPLGISQHGD